MRTFFPWLLISSCAGVASPERAFSAPPGDVRAAVLAALAGQDDVRTDGDVVLTGWGPERGSGSQGFVLGHGYVYRARYEVRLAGSAAAVEAVVERRAPGGVRSRRWERVDGAPAAEALLRDVAARLEKAP